jgi:hypothetical protein
VDCGRSACDKSDDRESFGVLGVTVALCCGSVLRGDWLMLDKRDVC